MLASTLPLLQRKMSQPGSVNNVQCIVIHSIGVTSQCPEVSESGVNDYSLLWLYVSHIIIIHQVLPTPFAFPGRSHGCGWDDYLCVES